MRLLIFIAGFCVVGLCCCKPKPTDSGKVVVHIDTSSDQSITKYNVVKADSCILRFRGDFYNDTVTVGPLKGDNKFTVLTTNRSIAFAGSLAIKKGY